MTPKAAVAFIERHGIVLERATGSVPSVVDVIAGARKLGSLRRHE
jgi:hypothetical protein